jgi:virulence-associated protein VagC
MNSIRYLIAILLFAISNQSQALFMPAGFQLNPEKVDVSNDGGC